MRAVFILDPSAIAPEPWADKTPAYTLHRRGLGLLELAGDDSVGGTEVTLADIRQLAQEVTD